MKKRSITTAIGTAVLGAAMAMLVPVAGVAQPAPLDGLDAYVEQAMDAWEVPGLALAVVKDDSIVHARGFGVRELGGGAPVDENTLFAIGSSSKAFTTASLAMLADEDALAWDDPATRHLPGLQLHDPYATRELSVRDLVIHDSGLPRCDQLWYGTSYDRDEVLRRIRHCEPAWSFRSRFGYQNVMFLAAGRIVSRVSGLRWDDFVADRIFAPLGMTRSSTSVDSLEEESNVASPHEEIGGAVRPVAWRDIDNIGPAGSINSSVRDMARWVRLHLGEGELEGERLLSADAVREMHSPQMLIESDGPEIVKDSHFQAYGLGWFLRDYRGVKIVEHGGAIDGMRAQVALVPEEELGLVVLTNRGGSVLGVALMYSIIDRYIGAPETDWADRYLSRTDSLAEEREEEERELREARLEGTTPSLPLEEYAGTYADSLYGTIEIAEESGGLVLTHHAFTADLEHWHLDTFRADWRDELADERGLESSLLTFRLDARGRVEAVEVPGRGGFGRVRESR